MKEGTIKLSLVMGKNGEFVKKGTFELGFDGRAGCVLFCFVLGGRQGKTFDARKIAWVNKS